MIAEISNSSSGEMIPPQMGPRRDQFVHEIKMLSRKATLAKLCQQSKDTSSNSFVGGGSFEVLTSCSPKAVPYKTTGHPLCSRYSPQATSVSLSPPISSSLSVNCPQLTPPSSQASAISTDSFQLETLCSLSERAVSHSRTYSVPVTPSLSHQLEAAPRLRSLRFLKNLKKILKLSSKSSVV